MADEKDPLYEQAVSLVVGRNKASTSLIQRTFLIGYNRAARLLEAMEVAGVVSPMSEYGHRSILKTERST